VWCWKAGQNIPKVKDYISSEGENKVLKLASSFHSIFPDSLLSSVRLTFLFMKSCECIQVSRFLISFSHSLFSFPLSHTREKKSRRKFINILSTHTPNTHKQSLQRVPCYQFQSRRNMPVSKIQQLHPANALGIT